ncbi:MAG TPA: hypothetical protein VD994_21220 [Prosthecobacter sp.]|nr:hypothetical protein [Prosthecobacter sp.]
MKTIYSLVAAVIGAGFLASCVQPYAADSGPTPLRTSGAYSAQFRGAGSTYHSRDVRDPAGDWRHDDEVYEDDDDDDGVAYRSRYVEPAPHYTSYRTWRPDMGPAELPHGSRRVMVDGQVFYTAGNVWYRPAGSGFVVVRSPY